MRPIVDGLEEEYDGELQVVRLDFGDRANRKVLRALRVSAHPTTALIGRDGTVRATWVGERAAAEIRPLVQSELGR